MPCVVCVASAAEDFRPLEVQDVENVEGVGQRVISDGMAEPDWDADRGAEDPCSVVAQGVDVEPDPEAGAADCEPWGPVGNPGSLVVQGVDVLPDRPGVPKARLWEGELWPKLVLQGVDAELLPDITEGFPDSVTVMIDRSCDDRPVVGQMVVTEGNSVMVVRLSGPEPWLAGVDCEETGRSVV